jgi:outer membrane protein assembly factor BamD (BamD/ComL family)
MLPKRISTVLLASVLFLGACETKKKGGGDVAAEQALQFPESIAELEAELAKIDNRTAAIPVARKLEKELLQFATENRKDTTVAQLVYKAARLNETYFENYQEAFGHYNSIAEDYPDTKYAPVSFFKRGLIMETYFKKSDKAIYYLDEYLKKYPGHKLNDMAKQIITTTGVDPRDLLERIKQKEADTTAIN